ncbi:MAG: HAD-IA family hydrolase [Clostridiales bacterium]|jgi:phosphoglycolate phosphatase-like HAD superfamily hydrolase|nr:HAD-IA family hydrolase [Clostridiales bacterium]
MYKHIIWDFDGTLFDTYPVMTKAALMALEENGIIEPYDKIFNLMKTSFSTLFDYFYATYSKDVGEKVISDFYKHRRKTEAGGAKPFPYAADVCRRICESGRYNHLCTHRGESSIKYLREYDMLKYFSGLATESSNFKRKPDPEALLWLMKEFDIDKSEALMVGDRDIDILAARNAGMDGCYYKGSPLFDCGYAKYTVTDLRQILDILEL